MKFVLSGFESYCVNNEVHLTLRSVSINTILGHAVSLCNVVGDTAAGGSS